MYSYKNCYGLSEFPFVPFVVYRTYSYKNCYGLSEDGSASNLGTDVFVQELLWFI